ncbi:MAG: hypothetical protein IJ639_01635 [Ruminococcus sp.]|nr:hypothetical protein [Ruminococcus sp.]
MEVLIAILSGGAAVALIEGLREWLGRRYEQRARKEALAQRKIEERLTAMEEQNIAQSEALKYILYDRIRFLGQAYIAAGEIDFDDRRILNSMHAAYHSGLKGNGDLDNLMRDVNALRLKRKEG